MSSKNFISLAVVFLLLIIPLLSTSADPPVRYQIGNGAIQNAISQDVISDYGARAYSGYDWHKGIDYGFGYGYHIMPIVTGVS